MQRIIIADGLALDSTGTNGATNDCTPPHPMGDTNAAQVEILVYALTATNVEMQAQSSSDGVNWTNKGSAQTMTSIGRKQFTVESSIGAAFIRVKFTITGTGKAVIRAALNLSQL